MPAALLKRDSNTGSFLWIFQKFYEQLFYRAPLVAASESFKKWMFREVTFIWFISSDVIKPEKYEHFQSWHHFTIPYTETMFTNEGNKKQFQGSFGREFWTWLSLWHNARSYPLPAHLSKDETKKQKNKADWKNSLLANVSILHPLKTPKNKGFPLLSEG